jgi:hypothetical protein
MMVRETQHGGRTWGVGQRVRCNGHDGTIARLFRGEMAGMVEVFVPGGMACISLRDLALENPDTEAGRRIALSVEFARAQLQRVEAALLALDAKAAKGQATPADSAAAGLFCAMLEEAVAALPDPAGDEDGRPDYDRGCFTVEEA